MARDRERTDSLYVLTVDPVLAEDITDRIAVDPRSSGVAVVRPRCEDIPSGVEEIDALGRDTRAARLLIFDVRSLTLPRLRQAYNRIVGYNRHDFNVTCFTILIGDGPVSLFRAGRSLQVFRPHLAAHRIDYSAAVFFYDPFLHYTPEERLIRGIDAGENLPELAPHRLERAFKGSEIPVREVREYFRAAALSGQARLAAMDRRQERLAKFYRKRIAEEFPHHAEQCGSWLRKEGCVLVGESLRLHLYPFHFTDWVFDLLAKAAGR